jgi:hypothetical protein
VRIKQIRAFEATQGTNTHEEYQNILSTGFVAQARRIMDRGALVVEHRPGVPLFFVFLIRREVHGPGQL